MRGLRLVAAVILLLAVGAGGEILIQSQRVPVLLDGPDETGPPPVNPRTAPAIACLRKELPRHFDETKYAQFDAAVKRCLGDSPLALQRSGVDALPFGRDARTGRGVELTMVATVGDVAPNIAAAVEYTAKLSEAECECLGGVPMARGGCGPDRFLRVPQNLGIPKQATLVRADGRAVIGISGAARVFRRFPDDPPQTIAFRTKSGTREIRYVSWGAIQRLSKLFAQVRRRFPHPPSCRRHAVPVVTVAGVVVHPRCRDVQTRAWLRLARAIEVVPETVLDARPGDEFPGCNAHQAPAMALSVTRGDVTFEARFVSWMARGSGRAKGARVRAPAR